MILALVVLAGCSTQTQFRASPADGKGGNSRFFDADSIDCFKVSVALHRKGAATGTRSHTRDLGTFCRTTTTMP